MTYGDPVNMGIVKTTNTSGVPIQNGIVITPNAVPPLYFGPPLSGCAPVDFTAKPICFQHVVRKFRNVGSVAQGECELCGESVLLPELDLTHFLQRLKALMGQALSVLDTPDEALETLVTIGIEISSQL